MPFFFAAGFPLAGNRAGANRVQCGGVHVYGVHAADGKMEASYYNPQPLRAAKAKAQTDQLHEVYFQAALQQKFEEVFVRMK